MAPSNSFIPLPFGARDLKVYPLTGESFPNTGIDLANYQKLTFAEAESFEEMRGDDALVSVHGKGPSVNWEIDGGGVTLDVTKVIQGGTITETGIWNNGAGTGVRTYSKTSLDLRPYFRVEGQAISDSGGDFHVVLFRCRATGDFTVNEDENAFMVNGYKGQALPRLSDGSLYDLVQNEQITPVP